MIEKDDKKCLNREDAILIRRIIKDNYFSKIIKLSDIIFGKVVEETFEGASGFILSFNDNTYLLCYINSDGKLDYIYNSGKPDETDSEKIKSVDLINIIKNFNTDLGDIRGILMSQSNLKKCTGLKIKGIAAGVNTFNICFEDFMELDNEIINDKNGQEYLLVRWNKW